MAIVPPYRGRRLNVTRAPLVSPSTAPHGIAGVPHPDADVGRSSSGGSFDAGSPYRFVSQPPQASASGWLLLRTLREIVRWKNLAWLEALSEMLFTPSWVVTMAWFQMFVSLYSRSAVRYGTSPEFSPSTSCGVMLCAAVIRCVLLSKWR